jgi:preprotein translocase subunit SecE|tara:strand:+ start:325 stop:537 length:213 start_codon:yes stop_codon:yes gene_type:complete
MAVLEKIKDTQTFVEECWVELQKVTWPDQDQLRSATIVVVAFTIVVSLIIWFMDKISGYVVDFIMSIFGA